MLTNAAPPMITKNISAAVNVNKNNTTETSAINSNFCFISLNISSIFQIS